MKIIMSPSCILLVSDVRLPDRPRSATSYVPTSELLLEIGMRFAVFPFLAVGAEKLPEVI